MSRADLLLFDHALISLACYGHKVRFIKEHDLLSNESHLAITFYWESAIFLELPKTLSVLGNEFRSYENKMQDWNSCE